MSLRMYRMTAGLVTLPPAKSQTGTYYGLLCILLDLFNDASGRLGKHTGSEQLDKPSSLGQRLETSIG